VTRAAQLTPAGALARLPGPAGERYRELFAHGSLSVEIYAPVGVDPQQPHDRDELYVVVAGSGRFLAGRDAFDFKSGDLLFVPAGMEHRFADFSADFAVWVVFYGPVGGEASAR
jgi:mannose-6-phosphate isomerase-like protein (cupin superfamily)